jgi:hypothetical protein
MNENRIVPNRFSNPESQNLYGGEWISNQCGGCSFFAPFDDDWGLCCHKKSHHRFETVFEHFGCESYVDEGWGPHSFSENPDFHCWCNGEPLQQNAGVKVSIEDRLIKLIKQKSIIVNTDVKDVVFEICDAIGNLSLE